MIIKKKYASIIKKAIDEAPAEDTLSVINDAAAAFEENEDNEEYIEDAAEEFSDEEKEEETPENIRDLDLSLDNITFEQREERREGSRRRGYRRSQDRNILTRAQQEAVSIREAAKKEGYEDGIKNAGKDLEEIKEKLAQFFDCSNEVYEKVSGCILDIAVQIAKKIIKKEIDENQEYIIPIIKEMIEDINKTENKIIIKVMPKDAEIVQDRIEEIFSGKNFEAKISVIPDNSVKDGGVIIETSNGIADASISTQLAIIEQALKKQEGAL